MNVETIEQAFELSLLKWKYISQNKEHNYSSVDLSIKHPQLTELHMMCGLCEYVFETMGLDCTACPIHIKSIDGQDKETFHGGCDNYLHPYKRWANEENDVEKRAKAVLALIRRRYTMYKNKKKS